MLMKRIYVQPQMLHVEQDTDVFTLNLAVSVEREKWDVEDDSDEWN